MISAKDAYEMSELKKYLDFIEGKIKETAKEGETSVTIWETPYACWLVDEGQRLKGAGKMAIAELRECGYDVSLVWKDNRYATSGLVIDWGEAGEQP
jgi:hypothetical protein